MTTVKRANLLSVPRLAVLAACLALTAGAAWAQSLSKTATATKTTTAAQDGTSHRKPTPKTMRDALAPPEDLTGSITYVNPSDREVTLTGANGIPYDFQLTGRTQVQAANQRIPRQAVSTELQKHATIHFVPTVRGNFADSISIG